MADTVENRNIALDVAKLIDEHLGENTVVLELGEMSSWADFFVISTVRSKAHLTGLVKHLKDYFREKHITILNSYKTMTFSGWELIDCGSIVIHLMDSEKRDFYQLERLWFKSKILYHSSKSS